MSYVNPIWLEGQRQRWLRHDAHRFAPPEPPKSYAARWIERRQAEEKQAAIAAEQEALRNDLERLRWLVRDLKVDLAIRRLRLKYGYNPNRPRDELGRWTDVGRSTGEETNAAQSQVSIVDSRDKDGLIVSDVTADGARVWAQYAEADDRKVRDDATIERTTKILHDTLLKVSGTVVRNPGASPQLYGTAVHTEFAKAVRAMNLPGIGSTGVEQSFDKDGEARYGTDGSIRTDVTLRNEEGRIIAIYDLKTGNATIRPSRADELRARTGSDSDVPVIELHAIRTSEKDRIYLWRIVAPLYRPIRHIVLNYSDRIPHGRELYARQGAFDKAAAAIHDVIVDGHLDYLRGIETPEDFLRHADWITDRSPILSRVDRGLTLCLAGDLERGIAELRKLSAEVGGLDERRAEYLAPLFARLAAVFDEPVWLTTLLEEWVAQNVERLGLQGSLPAT